MSVLSTQESQKIPASPRAPSAKLASERRRLFLRGVFHWRGQFRADERLDAVLNDRVALNFDMRLLKEPGEPRVSLAADGARVVVELKISDNLRP